MDIAYNNSPIDISHNVISYSNTIHNIIEDYIDINIETSRRIFYCDKCFMTFSSSTGKSNNICSEIIKPPNHQQRSDYH